MKNQIAFILLSSSLLLSGCMKPYSNKRIIDPSSSEVQENAGLANPNWNRESAPDILNGDRENRPDFRPAVVISPEDVTGTEAAPPSQAPPVAQAQPASANPVPAQAVEGETEQPVVQMPRPVTTAAPVVASTGQFRPIVRPSPTPLKVASIDPVVARRPIPVATPLRASPTPAPTPQVSATPKPQVSATPKPQVAAPTPIPSSQRPAPRATPAPAPAAPAERVTVASPTNHNIVENGIITPTVYFLPVMDEDESRCPGETKVGLMLTNGTKRMDVCRRTLSFCSEQGSCMIKKNGKWSTFNVIRRVAGIDQYKEITDGCVYGYGVQNICLDPFYSVAADLNIYRAGDVIFLPALRGMVLPNGQKHDGYLIVRDQGRGVKGKGRFDFFSGAMSWTQASNPFVRLKLGDKDTDLAYQRVDSNLAATIRQKRGYPKLPRMLVALTNESNTAGVPTSPLSF